MPHVLDACAVIAYLRHEQGAELVRDLLGEEPPACMIHAVNFCEVYYDSIRCESEAAARTVVQELRSIGLAVREDMDEAFWQQIGRYKAAHRMALADAFAVALADRVDADVVTSDRREFEPLAARNVCRVRFIR